MNKTNIIGALMAFSMAGSVYADIGKSYTFNYTQFSYGGTLSGSFTADFAPGTTSLTASDITAFDFIFSGSSSVTSFEISSANVDSVTGATSLTLDGSYNLVSGLFQAHYGTGNNVNPPIVTIGVGPGPHFGAVGDGNDYSDFSPAPTPEPATFALAGLGGAALLFRRRK